MVMKLNKSVFRVMRENKGQYIGMFLMVLLSSYLFVMFALLATNLNQIKNTYFEDHVQGDLEFYTASRVENLSSLEQEFGLKIEETIVTEKSIEDRTIRFFTPNERVNIPAILEGRLPGAREVALDQQFVQANGLSIGTAIELEGRQYVISGVVSLPNYAYILQKEGDIANDPTRFGIGVMNKQDLTAGNFLYSVKFNTPQDNINEQARPLRAAINAQNAGILSWNYARYDMKTNIPNVYVLAISAYAYVLPTVFILISTVLVAVVLGRMVKAQMGVIGTLYALGYRKKEIMRHYLCYPLALGAAGSIVGSIFGIGGFMPMLNMMLAFMPMPITQISYNPLFFVISILSSILILCFGTYLALGKVLRSTPVSLMRKESTKKLNFIEIKLKLGNMPFRRKFSIREQLRSLPRVAFLLIGVLIATSLLMFGFIAKSTLDHLISQDINQTIDYKYEYVMNRPQTAPPPEGGEALAGMKFVPDIDYSDRFEIVGVSPQTQKVSLVDMRGDTITITDEIAAIGRTMARQYRLGIGDTITFTDIIYDRENSITITHIADTSIGNVIFVSIDRFSEIMGWEKGAYNAVISNVPLSFDDGMVYLVKTPESLSDALAEYMTLMNLVLYGIAVVAAVIGLIIMYILASISIDENKGNISLMKAFGYKKKEVGSLIVNGSRVFVFFGYVVGAPLAYVSIGQFLFFMFGLMRLTIEPRLEWYFVLLGIVLIFLAFELSKTACMKKIRNVSMSEALKAQSE